MNYQASNPESLSETPERLSETKTRSGSAAKKRAAEVLTSCTNLTARLCMTVTKLLNLRGHPGSEVIGRAKRAPHWGVQSRFRVIYIYVSVVCQITWNHVNQTRACSK